MIVSTYNAAAPARRPRRDFGFIQFIMAAIGLGQSAISAQSKAIATESWTKEQERLAAEEEQRRQQGYTVEGAGAPGVSPLVYVGAGALGLGALYLLFK